MTVLVLGGYGFIGSEIVRALLSQSVRVIGAGRDIAFGQRIFPGIEWRRLDLAGMVEPSSWQAALEGIEVVVNASGLLQDGDGGRVRTVQRDSIVALIKACEQSGVRRFVQISAAGVGAKDESEFMSSKAAADLALARSTVDHVIFRPGLVIGRNSYGGTDLLRIIAALPLILPEIRAAGRIQTVAMNDVVEAVTNAVTAPALVRGPIDLVERSSHSLGDILAAHRRWLGLPIARRIVPVPDAIVRLVTSVGDILGRLGWRPAFRSNAWQALASGVAGNSEQTRACLGREPLSLEQGLNAFGAGKQDRVAARLGLLLPLLMTALCIMWLSSALATLANIGRATSLLAPVHLPDSVKGLAVVGGAILDLTLAICLLHRTTARPALIGMAGLTIVYLAIGTLVVPGLWTDPLAPFAKTLPAAVAALVAATLIERR